MIYMEIQVEISRNCPLNCIHCSSKELRARSEKRKFYNKDLVQLINYIEEDKQIFFTGGEPLCYSGLQTLCKEIGSIPNTSIGLFTCGILEKNGRLFAINHQFAEKLRSIGIRKCYLSIYGVDASSHNSISNEPSYDLTCESIKVLNAAGISTNAHVVLMKNTVEHFDKIVESISSMGIDSVRVLRLAKVGSAIDNWDLIGVNSSIQKQTVEHIIDTSRQQNKNVSISGFPELVPCRLALDAVGCQRGKKVLYITYEGDVFPCACTKGNANMCLGNLKHMHTILSRMNEYKCVSHFPTCINSDL